jgi:hypothetical protein
MGGQPLTTAACPLLINLQTGVCRRGDACPYSHGVFECWLHPSRYRTQVRAECCIGLSVAFGWRARLPWQLQLPRHAGRHRTRLGTMLLPCPVLLASRLPCCSHPACLALPRRCALTAPAAAAASASLPTLSMNCGGQRTTRPCSTSSCTPAWWQVRPRGLFGCRLSCCGLCCCVVGQDGTLHDFLEARKQPWKQ